MSDEVRRTVLDNGLRIVTERMPEARSVTVGVWAGVGGRDEPSALAGASHFLEHLVFKGTARRSAKEIAQSVDAVGGEMNAFTGREYTSYYARLPSSSLGFGLDLLTDVLGDPALRAHEVDAEREVILEELALSEDTPDDKVLTMLGEAVFPGHPLGREVLGDEETVADMSRDDIAGFFAERYTPDRLVMAAAGDLDHDDVVDGARSFLAGAGPAAAGLDRQPPQRPPEASSHQARPTEQAHVALGWRAFDHHDGDRYALAVANQVLGGGMASRLFQEVREERGLAYSVYSATSAYSDSGLLMVYAGTFPAKLAEVLSVIEGVVAAMLDAGVTELERAVATGYLEGSLLLGLEDSGSRMGRIGRAELTRGRVPPVDEEISHIRAVTLDDVHRVLTRVLSGPRSMATVGPLEG